MNSFLKIQNYLQNNTAKYKSSGFCGTTMLWVNFYFAWVKGGYAEGDDIADKCFYKLPFYKVWGEKW